MVYIGQVEPWEPARGFLGVPLDEPQWFILRTSPQKESAAAAKLAAHGVPETWYPTEPAWRRARGKRDRIPYERRIAPGYLFACFDREPVWHRVMDTLGRFVVGVVGIGDQPYAVPLATLRQMKQVPKRIELLREQETAKEKAARLARLPQPGSLARLTQGPLAGFVIQVERIDRGIAAFILDGIRGTAEAESMERLPESAPCAMEGQPRG